MPREALKWQKTLTIGATKYPMRAIDTVTARAVDYLRSMLRSELPNAREWRTPDRKYRFRSTPVAEVADINVVLFFEHDGRPLSPKLKELRDFNVVEQAVRNGVATSEDQKQASLMRRIASKFGGSKLK